MMLTCSCVCTSYYNKQAIATIAKMAAANGFAKIVTGVDGLMSTPCVSDVIRKLKLFGGHM